VTAAPLVVLLDEYTTATGGKGGRYATIAAVIGLSTSSSSGPSTESTTFAPPPPPPASLCTSGDNADFMESLQHISSSSSSAAGGSAVKAVRFVGIGRAVVTDFFYQSVHEDQMDEEGHLLHVPNNDANNDNDDDDDDDEYHERDTNNHIIMGRFRLFSDAAASAATDHPSSRRRRRRRGTAVSSPYASPVHALADCSQWVSKIHLLHEERKQLVAGLHAAQARLALSAQQQQQQHLPPPQQQQQQYSDDYEDDYDGFGLLFASKQQDFENDEAEQMVDQKEVIEQILLDYPADSSSKSRMSSEQLEGLSNYGLGVTVSAVTTLAAITDRQLERLRPYYSPAKVASEEFYYEVYSFVALAALVDAAMERQAAWDFAAWAVRQCPSTADRLRHVWDRQWEHVLLLRQEVAAKSQQLRDCGEECTDLW
jgi:hypothetical protein